MKKYIIMARRQPVEVTEEVYKAYYQEIEKERYAEKKKNYKICESYNALDTDEMLGEELMRDMFASSIEEKLMEKELVIAVRTAVEMLCDKEQELINALFYKGMTEREYAEKSGIPRPTLHSRKKLILNKIKINLKNF